MGAPPIIRVRKVRSRNFPTHYRVSVDGKVVDSFRMASSAIRKARSLLPAGAQLIRFKESRYVAESYMLPPAKVEAFLARAEEKIRFHGKRSVQSILAIGRELASVKEHVEHGQYTAFVTERLGWSTSAASRFVQVFEMTKHPNLGSLEGLTIDATSLYRLAAPSTPEPAREEILELAATPEGVSHTESKRIVSEAKRAASPPPPPTAPAKPTPTAEIWADQAEQLIEPPAPPSADEYSNPAVASVVAAYKKLKPIEREEVLLNIKAIRKDLYTAEHKQKTRDFAVLAWRIEWLESQLGRKVAVWPEMNIRVGGCGNNNYWIAEPTTAPEFAEPAAEPAAAEPPTEAPAEPVSDRFLQGSRAAVPPGPSDRQRLIIATRFALKAEGSDAVTRLAATMGKNSKYLSDVLAGRRGLSEPIEAKLRAYLDRQKPATSPGTVH